MKLKISNRADAFFDLFSEAAENTRIAAELLLDLIEDFTDVEVKARRIQEREHEGDREAERVAREQERPLHDGVGRPGEHEDGGEHRADARRRADCERTTEQHA